MNNNFAVIGSSPIMIILAHELIKRGNKVKIIDFRSNIGGAWSYANLNDSKIATQTNVIVPDNDFEEENIPKLNNYLVKNFNIKIEENKDKFEPLGYLAKKNYDYDLRNIYNLISNNTIPREKIFVDKIVQKKNDVMINDKFVFDKVFISTYTGVSKITIDDQEIDVTPNEIVSEHILLVSKKIKTEYLTYSENFDKNFDRVQIKNINNLDVLTGRIRKEKKGQNIEKLIVSSNLTDNNDIIKIESYKYKNFYRDFDQRKKLKEFVSKSNIEYVNTALFVEAFFELNNKYNLTSL